MRLHKKLKNEECIGKKITAQPGIKKSWVKYEDGNNGEKNYYRDVYDKKTGTIVYMYGEFCFICGFNEQSQIVSLKNEDLDLNSFEIPYEQYISDFGDNWNY